MVAALRERQDELAEGREERGGHEAGLHLVEHVQRRARLLCTGVLLRSVAGGVFDCSAPYSSGTERAVWSVAFI